MKEYRTSFQCPDTGETVIAKYAFGQVTVTPAGDATEADTLRWCKQHTNKRCKSVEEADDYIVIISEGQFGFDL